MRLALHNLFSAVAILIATAVLPLCGQQANAPLPDPLGQLMVSQPSIEIVTNPVASASFDPPLVRRGELSTYRLTFNALEDSVRLPEAVNPPPGMTLRQSARGQILLYAGNRLVPQTTINFHAHVTNVGPHVMRPFTVEVYGQTVTVPAARLDVLPATSPGLPPGRRLTVELLATNIYVGQSVGVRVVMPGSPINAPQRLAQAKLTGDGILVDHTVARQTVTATPHSGPNQITSIHETRLTPLVAGELRFSAQGFASGGFTSGAILMPSQSLPGGMLGPEVLLDSDPVTFTALPLPQAGELPGFTGAIGNFACDPPHLSTTRVSVGEPIQLTVIVRGEGNLARLVLPPAPSTTQWKISEPVKGGPAPPMAPVAQAPGLQRLIPAGPAMTFGYMMTPLAPGLTATPAIPFSCFDPEHARYVDLTIPSVPIEVTEGTLTKAARLWAEAGLSASNTNPPLVLSTLSPSPGRRRASLLPLQWHGWFVLVQVLPLMGFAGLWAWDRRRRFLEHHPELVRRRRARRALRKARRDLLQAFDAADALRFAEAAVRAMRVACAPHFPAEPGALVGHDVLEVLEHQKALGNVVRKFFAVTDASHFSLSPADARELLALKPGLEQVLQDLEARL